VSKFAAITSSLALIGALFFGAPAAVYAEVNDIYVGSIDHVTGGSCADPDFSTDDVSGEGSINAALDAALAEVDDDADTIIICDGAYIYEDDISLHDGDVDHDVINIAIEAAAEAEVTLDGNELYQLLDFENTSVSVSGIDFLDGYVTGSGAAIAVLDGTLDVIDSTFTSNFADVTEGDNNGGAIWVEGSLTVNHSSFSDNAGHYGGAIFVNGTGYIDGQTIIADVLFDSNYAQGEGGAIWVDDSQLTVLRSFFTDNTADVQGGAIYAYDSDWSVSHSIFGSAGDDHDDSVLNNSASEGGDIYSATGTTTVPVTGTITHSKFYDSQGFEGPGEDGLSGDGASLFMGCTALNLSNSLFHSTESDTDAVIYLADDDETCTDYRATISRTTFTDNYAASDGVIYVDAGNEANGISGLLSLSVTDSLFTGNVGDVDEGVFDVEGPVDISIINSRFERNSAGDNGAIIEMDGGDDESITTNGSLTFSRNQVRFNSGGTSEAEWDYAKGDGMIQLEDLSSWRIDYNTFQGNTADRGAVLALVVDDDDLQDLIQLNGFKRNKIIRNSASVGGSYLFIQYDDNASYVKRASIRRIETQVNRNRNSVRGGARPAVLQLPADPDEG
jgi:predicted outer membrane repeat protein